MMLPAQRPLLDEMRPRKGFAFRDFVLCGLPYKRSQGPYVRQNGKFLELRISTSDPDVGIPFGVDRLLPIWLATAYAELDYPEDRTIEFRCFDDFRSAFDPVPRVRQLQDGRQVPRWGGRDTREWHHRILRVFHATFSRRQINGRGWGRWERYQLLEEAELYFGGASPRQHSLWRNRIVLDERFARELREHHVVPIDLRVVHVLRRKSLALDLYCWQAYRSFRIMGASEGVKVPLFGAGGLVEQLGVDSERSPRYLRRDLKAAQEQIREAWPECPNALELDRYVYGRPNGVMHLWGARAVPAGIRSRLPGIRRAHPKLPLDGGAKVIELRHPAA